MCADSPITSFTARYVFPVAGPPLAGGCVTIRGERIVAVETRPAQAAIDLGDVAILPAFVNAHTHLEFSDLPAPLGRAGMPLPEWIRLVIATRRNAGGDRQLAIDRGIAECLRTGSCALGEIATSGWADDSISALPIDLVAFHELLGLRTDRVSDRLADAVQFVAIASAAAQGSRWRAGISPHAPYSVHPNLAAGLIRLAAAQRIPVAMHLAESREELALLADGTGPFREMLEELGAWDPAAIPPGTRPLDYLRLLAAAPRALVIHGNYLAADELEFVARQADRMSVVYCPRTHSYFGHERYPLERLLGLGASIALGTDSRASNPDLNLLAEVRLVARQFPKVAPEIVLQMGTLAGAKALDSEPEIGSLVSGKLANLAIVPISSRAVSDPHELVFESDAPVTIAYYRGRPVTAGNS
jgi:aminodeoxyfutalosine deaminase